MSKSDPTPEPETPSSQSAAASLRELAIFIAVGAALLTMGIVLWRSRTAESRRSPTTPPRFGALYAGEASCRECHPGESALYHRSGHSQTLRLVADREDLIRWLDGKQAADPADPDASFHYQHKDGQLSAVREAPDSSESRVLEYAFGSGHHATTFVTVTDPDPAHPAAIEHRLTYFAEGPRLDITPGQGDTREIPPEFKTPEGHLLDAAAARMCFSCHVTILSDRDPSVLDVATMVKNVSCERCHGPGQAHIEAARRGESPLKMPFGRRGSTPRLEIKLCGQCHRTPEQVPPDSIRPDNPQLVRFQSVGLVASRCFNESDGGFGCVACHDPHARTSPDMGSYEAACLKCHKAAPQTVCRVSPDKGCIACHMPRREAGSKVAFTDHWIRIVPPAGSPASPPTVPKSPEPHP